MLMDILMEALMSMDDESLDYVLESCDAEELEIIDSAIEARFEDGPTVVDKRAVKSKIINNTLNNVFDRSNNTQTDNKYDLDKKLKNKYNGRAAGAAIGYLRNIADKSGASSTKKELLTKGMGRSISLKNDPAEVHDMIDAFGTKPEFISKKSAGKNMTADQKRSQTAKAINETQGLTREMIKMYNKRH